MQWQYQSSYGRVMVGASSPDLDTIERVGEMNIGAVTSHIVPLQKVHDVLCVLAILHQVPCMVSVCE